MTRCVLQHEGGSVMCPIPNDYVLHAADVPAPRVLRASRITHGHSTNQDGV